MLPKAANPVDVELTVFNSGWVPAHKNIVVSGAKSEEIRMPALFAMIRHPEKGIALYDTGYNTSFYEATRKPPYRIMRTLTPAEITEDDNVDRQLAKRGIQADEVRTIVLGHGHVDHVPGIRCFPGAKVVVERREWETMQGSALKIFAKGYVKSLYEGITNEIELVDVSTQGGPYGPFPRALDLWDDGSMILVPLPGHTAGQLGLLVNLSDGRRVFFVGDAAWLRDNYLLLKPPARIARAILSSFADFESTLKLINGFSKENPEVIVVPAHCPAAWSEIQDLGLAG